MSIADQIKVIVAKLEAIGEPFDAIQSAHWIPVVETRFGHRLPASFRYLVTGYAFPEFEIGGVTVFSNLNDGSPMDITVAPFADPFMSPWLISRGYVQFGRRDAVNYDPVCFDFSGAKSEPPVVVLDHEDILLERRKVRVQQVSESLIQLVEAALHNKALQGDARNARA
jgi:hypothetical protein